MLNDKSKNKLQKIQSLRKDKITIFGGSIELDWFILNLIAFSIFVSIFYFSFAEVRNLLTYEPEPDLTTQNVLNDKKTLKDLDDLILNLESREEPEIIEEVNEEIVEEEE